MSAAGPARDLALVWVKTLFPGCDYSPRRLAATLKLDQYLYVLDGSSPLLGLRVWSQKNGEVDHKLRTRLEELRDLQLGKEGCFVDHCTLDASHYCVLFSLRGNLDDFKLLSGDLVDTLATKVREEIFRQVCDDFCSGAYDDPDSVQLMFHVEADVVVQFPAFQPLRSDLTLDFDERVRLAFQFAEKLKLEKSKDEVATLLAERPAKVVARPPLDPPVINAFRLDRMEARFGDEVTVTWDVTGANQLFLQPCGAPLSGSTGSIRLVARVSTTYYLCARNWAADEVSESLELIVRDSLAVDPVALPNGRTWQNRVLFILIALFAIGTFWLYFKSGPGF